MKSALVAAMAGTLFAAAAPAANLDHPYRHIPERNVFNLLPIRPPPTNVPPQLIRPIPLKIFITGLVEIGGVSKALLEINEPGKPVHRHILAAGSGLDSVRILDVNVPAGNVRILLDGNEETLTLQKPKFEPSPPVHPPLPPPVPRMGLPVRG